MSTINRQWRIARRPDGRASVTDFEWREEPVPVPGAGQVLVRNLYLSLDPTNRPWMWAQDTYLPAQALGDVMRGLAIGRVEQSDDPAFPVGCHVSGLLGWQDYAVFGKGARVVRLPDDPSIPLTRHFGLFGHIGITAGLHHPAHALAARSPALRCPEARSPCIAIDGVASSRLGSLTPGRTGDKRQPSPNCALAQSVVGCRRHHERCSPGRRWYDCWRVDRGQRVYSARSAGVERDRKPPGDVTA